MANLSDPKEPAEMPAPVPQLNNIIAEGSREIGSQVRSAVGSILETGNFVDDTRLRKWGPQGAKYFFELLQRRVADKSQSLPPGERSAQNAIDRLPKADAGAEPNRVTSPRHNDPPVSTEKDWTAQQRNRWSTRARAIMRGMLVAALLFVGAMAFIRLLLTLVPVIQQQIQN
jgi:hypothetical protein